MRVVLIVCVFVVLYAPANCDIADFFVRQVRNISDFFEKKMRQLQDQLSGLLGIYSKGQRPYGRTFGLNSDKKIPKFKRIKYNYLKTIPGGMPVQAMPTPQIVATHGRRCESHFVISEDGYFLTLHRIINYHGNGNHTDDKKKTNHTVLLHHGLLGSSADWVFPGPNLSLPYLLLDAGWDVWMMNARGNYYSRGHITKPVNSIEYWSFSFEQMGLYDLRAVIDYITNATKSKSPITYIGHSIGATALVVLLSSWPAYNEKIKMGVLIAPLVFMAGSRGPLTYLSSVAFKPPKKLMRLAGDGEFLPLRIIPNEQAASFCHDQPFCKNPLFYITGILGQEVDAWDANFTSLVLSHIPAGGSTNTIVHLAQLISSGKFHVFGNPWKVFDLQRISAPMLIISSSDDLFATTTNSLKLYYAIKSSVEHIVVRNKNISHTQLVFGKNAKSAVFDKILHYLLRV